MSMKVKVAAVAGVLAALVIPAAALGTPLVAAAPAPAHEQQISLRLVSHIQPEAGSPQLRLKGLRRAMAGAYAQSPGYSVRKADAQDRGYTGEAAQKSCATLGGLNDPIWACW